MGRVVDSYTNILTVKLFARSSDEDAYVREVIDPDWSQFSFPTYYFYDVLRALDYLRDASAVPDERLEEAVALVEKKRTDDGRWLLENPHPGETPLDLDESEGNPSRWNTLRALRVLRWYDQR